MALELGSALETRVRFLLGGTTAATQGPWTPAHVAEGFNDAIKLLQNAEDDNTTRFMTKKLSVTSTGSADYTLSDAPFSVTDVRGIVSVRDDTAGTRYLESSDRQIEDGTKGTWTDAKLFAHTIETGLPHLRFVGAPANLSTIIIFYSHYHTLFTSGNLGSQNVEMPESYYGILVPLTALIMLTKKPTENIRMQGLITQLSMTSLPGRSRPITTTEAFNATIGQLVDGNRDTVVPSV